MPKESKSFVVTDPREFDGDPFDVANRAVLQTEALLSLTVEAVDDAYIMARNAEMERQFDTPEGPNAAAWPDTAAGKRWQSVMERLAQITTDLVVLRRVASFNPKSPPKE